MYAYFNNKKLKVLNFDQPVVTPKTSSMILVPEYDYM